MRSQLLSLGSQVICFLLRHASGLLQALLDVGGFSTVLSDGVLAGSYGGLVGFVWVLQVRKLKQPEDHEEVGGAYLVAFLWDLWGWLGSGRGRIVGEEKNHAFGIHPSSFPILRLPRCKQLQE